MTEVAPLSSPMIRVTYTWFLVPVKLAPVAVTWKAYRRMPVGLISVCRLTPSITHAKVKDPWPFFLKEPGGMVVVKAPTPFDRLGKRINPVAGAPAQGEAPLKFKAIVVRRTVFLAQTSRDARAPYLRPNVTTLPWQGSHL